MFRQGELANLKKILPRARIDDKILSATEDARGREIHSPLNQEALDDFTTQLS
jgi:hypothetical protein